MKRLRKLYNDANSLYDLLHEYVGDCDRAFEITFSMFNEAVDQLSERMDDHTEDGYSTINWFIYDNDWGFNEFVYGINGKDYVVADFNSLWDVLTEGK